MYLKYILTGTFVSTMLALFAGQLMAQDKNTQSMRDSTNSVQMDPGRLFDIDKRYSTAAISSVPGKVLNKTPTANLTNTLTGRLPGLYVKQGSEEPLGIPDMVNATSMTIRGIGSYGFMGNSGYYNALTIYVDGIETDLNSFVGLPASSIESVSVLKDAAALATFGMRGANGVLWVTTKRGNIGKPTVQFQIHTGRQQPINIYKPLGSYDYARLYNEALSNDNGNVWTPKYTDDQLQTYKNGRGTNVDWYDEVLRSTSPYTGGDLTFSGGDSTARYNVTLNYLNQQGLYNIVKSDETSNEMLKRYNIHANLDFTLFKIFDARVDIGGGIEDHNMPNYGMSDLWNNMARYPSNIYPVMADSAKWSGTSLYPDNPRASVNAMGWTAQHYRILLGNFGLRERLDFITPGLYLDESYSINSYAASSYGKTATYARYFEGATTTTDKTTPIAAIPQQPAGQDYLKQAKVTAGYEHLFGNNRIISAINYYQYNYQGDGLIYYADHYQNVSGRFNYSYKNRYVGEFGFSYFGSDAYAPGNQWKFYPAVSAAWIISNESFLQDNRTISFLKLRVSAGKTGGMGNNVYQSGRYLYQQYYQGASLTGGAFYMGNSNPTATSVLDPLYTANPDVFAEQSIKYNIGADISLINKLSLTMDVFLDKRSDILTTDNSIPDYFGYNILESNIGKVTNKGFEVSGVYTDKFGQVGYSISAMASFNRNRIDYMAETPPAYGYNASTGRAIGTPIGLVAIGYYQLDDFNADGSLIKGEPVPDFGAVQPGDLKYKDLDGDEKVDQTDVTAIGKSPYAELMYSFGANVDYKGFDVSVFFQGSGGSTVDIHNLATIQTEAFINNGNVFSIAENAWAYYPEQGIDTRKNATYPRLSTEANSNNYRPSSFWQKSADFLRLRNAEIGYTLPHSLLRKIDISQLRVYVNAVNLVTWSTLLKDYHLDPETISGYPNMKSYNVGFSVTF